MEINTEDLWARYYSARIDDETMIVIEQNPEQLQATLDATVSQKGVLSNVSVGMQGFVFAVSGRSYVIEYHPDEDMIGKDALNSGVSVASLEDGKFSWITLDGKEYYCGVQEIDQTYYISAIPEKRSWDPEHYGRDYPVYLRLRDDHSRDLWNLHHAGGREKRRKRNADNRHVEDVEKTIQAL